MQIEYFCRDVSPTSLATTYSTDFQEATEMADKVQKSIATGHPVEALPSGTDSCRHRSAKRSRFIRRIRERLLAFFFQPDSAVSASEQQALLPPAVRARYEW